MMPFSSPLSSLLPVVVASNVDNSSNFLIFSSYSTFNTSNCLSKLCFCFSASLAFAFASSYSRDMRSISSFESFSASSFRSLASFDSFDNDRISINSSLNFFNSSLCFISFALCSLYDTFKSSSIFVFSSTIASRSFFTRSSSFA